MGLRHSSESGSHRASDPTAAALVLAFLLVWLGLPHPLPQPPDCAHPFESSARDGVSWSVSCDSSLRPDAPLRGPARLLFGLRLDPNRASAKSLEALPGIGPRRAAAIVAARSRGPFRSLSELQRVPGIGPRTVEGLAGWAEVESAPLSAD